MTSNGAEMRFWALLRHHQPVRAWSTTTRQASPRPTAPSPSSSPPTASINVYTDRAGDPRLHDRRLHPGRHLHHRLDRVPHRLHFTGTGAQTYTLSKRANAADAWTQLKASAPPATTSRSGAPTPSPQTHGTLFRGLPERAACGSTTSATPTGIADAPADTTPPSAPGRSARCRPPRRRRRSDRPVLDRRHRQRRRHRLQALPRHRHRASTAPRCSCSPTSRATPTPPLSPARRYYYAVAALDAAGNEGPKSPEFSIAALDNTPPDTTQPSAPAALTAVDHAGDNGGAIDLSWTAATDNVAVTGYKLYRGTSPGVYGAPVALTNVTSYTDSTAVTGTTYYYAVAALDAAGNEGPKSPESSAAAADNTPPPDTTQPTAPATLSPSTTPVTPAARSTCPGPPPPTTSASPATSSTAAPRRASTARPCTLANVTSYTDATAVTGTRYYYAVAALDAAGNEGRQVTRGLGERGERCSRPRARRRRLRVRRRRRDPAPAWTRHRAPRSAPSTTPPAPRTARCRPGSRDRRPPPTAVPRDRLGGHDLKRRRVALLDLLRHRRTRTATSTTAPATSSSLYSAVSSGSTRRRRSTPTRTAPVSPATPPTPTPRRHLHDRLDRVPHRLHLHRHRAQTYTLSKRATPPTPGRR